MTKLITYPNSIYSRSFTKETKHITTKLDKRFKGVMKNLFPNTTKYVTKLVDMLGDKG